MYSKIVVSNISSYPVGIRIKTTKKDIYAVNPTYSLISPMNSLEVRVAYFIKEKDPDISKHKFKIEGIKLPDFVDDVKSIFDTYTKSKDKIVGNIIKKRVYHKIVNDEKDTRKSLQPSYTKEEVSMDQPMLI